jgi:heavy metal translocating P-type ATPase
MSPGPSPCDLCGLPIRGKTVSSDVSGKSFHFCCMGCRQVFHMLSEASDTPDPATFKNTELFKKCRELGIIPKSEADLEQQAQTDAPYHFEHKDIESPEKQKETPCENILRLNLVVKDMWCPACAWVIEEVLRRSDGLVNVSCNFSMDKVSCEYNPIRTSPTQIVHRINTLGYKAFIPGKEEQTGEKKREFIRFVISALLTMNIMMLSFALYSGFFTDLSQETILKLSFPIFVMATIVLFYGGRKIYQRAWAGMTSAAFSMETLITAGAFSAYIYSTVNLINGSLHLYYDTSSMLVTLVLLGKTLEERAKSDILQGLEKFFSLRPTKVKICSNVYPDGHYTGIEQLQLGDIFRVQVGEIIPADGLVVEGKGSLDESSLTGEAQPVAMKVGDRVKSGTEVMQGIFKVKAEAVADDSVLGQTITIMEKALKGKTPMEGKTDRALHWFVPAILLIAIATGLFCLLYGLTPDKAMMRAVTVMVIACPCTLGIAIPMARVAGISLAGKIGLLIRDFSSFDRVERLDTFVLDKTGTVTTGKWALQDIIASELFSEKQILEMAASLEQDSDHYIGMEIKKKAAERFVKPANVKNIKIFENGIVGEMDGDEIKIGSSAFLAKERETPFPLPAQGMADNVSYSRVFMGRGGRLCAVFIFGDSIKEGSHVAIDHLKSMNFKIVLISGDDEKTTNEIAEKIGIEEAHGGKLPHDKALYIKGLQGANHHVTMVGDGINDAPAMAQADLAMAVHAGGHLGKETAHVTMMRGDLRQITEFLVLSKKVNRKIYQNLIFSFLYNLISIPVAMSGLLTPIIAVSAMLMSSLTVIGNTLLLVKQDSRGRGVEDSSEIITDP